jgi:hypothetical protein
MRSRTIYSHQDALINGETIRRLRDYWTVRQDLWLISTPFLTFPLQRGKGQCLLPPRSVGED